MVYLVCILILFLSTSCDVISNKKKHRKLTSNCCICLLPIINDKALLKCNHLFHNKCINEWKIKNENIFNCPICRKKINIIISIV